MHRLRAVLALSCLSLAAPGHALAWGAAGHAIVADIAEARLSGSALTAVYNLLAVDLHSHLDEVGSWADAWRETHKETGPWHYVDIPITAPAYDRARDCPDGNCVIAKLAAYEKILADRTQPVAARVEALKFVVHFTGDLHQPLHSGENHDSGGNKIKASYFGETTAYGRFPMNLHSIWDTAIIERRLDAHETRDMQAAEIRQAAAGLAASLSAGIRPQEAKSWTAGGFAPARWATSAHDLARDVVYKGIVTPGQNSPEGPIALGADYDAAAWPVVEGQLDRAGVRLAAALDQALGTGPAPHRRH